MWLSYIQSVVVCQTCMLCWLHWDSLDIPQVGLYPPSLQQSHSLYICRYNTHLLKQPFTSCSRCNLYSCVSFIKPSSLVATFKFNHRNRTWAGICDTVVQETLSEAQQWCYWGKADIEQRTAIVWMWNFCLASDCEKEHHDGRLLESITLIFQQNYNKNCVSFNRLWWLAGSQESISRLGSLCVKCVVPQWYQWDLTKVLQASAFMGPWIKVLRIQGVICEAHTCRVQSHRQVWDLGLYKLNWLGPQYISCRAPLWQNRTLEWHKHFWNFFIYVELLCPAHSTCP